MLDIHSDRILILDYGSQYTQLIARRIREAGVYCEIHPWDMDARALVDFKARGIILSGGPESVTAVDAPSVPAEVFAAEVPVLGICYGMQVMAQQLGGKVEGGHTQEFGYAEIRARGHTALLRDIEDRVSPEGYGLLDVWMSHGDRVTELPPGFKLMASTGEVPIAGMADEERRYYGVQFHPEVTHTTQGQRILQHFLQDICGCGAAWTPGNIIHDATARVQEQVGTDKVLLALSGGVDSSVVAALLHRAIGDQLVCVFVDNGLLRLNEGDQVMQTFAEHLGVNVIRVDAQQRFLQALEGVADPEEKRKIIGRMFIEVFDEEAGKLQDVSWLAQGTIYPDVIESAGAATGKAHVIKSHHNVGGLPERMKLKLVEPLRELFKDEVRKLGLELGLPREQVFRHPFPGPGLGVRILGEVSPEAAETLRLADNIFISELRAEGLYDTVSQAFAVWLPVSSVGVTGDGRRYAPVIALRAVETIDFMTARWAHLPYEFLDRVSRRIVNEISGVSRVVYDVSGKPPATIEWIGDHDAGMRLALAQAETAAAAGEVPVGAVLVNGQGEVIASGANQPVARHDCSAHAEIVCLRRAGEKLGNYRLPGTTLYVTLEPCVMCAGAIIQARVAQVVYGAADPKAGAAGSVYDVLSQPRLNHAVDLLGGVMAEECGAMLQEFFRARRKSWRGRAHPR